MSDEFDLKELRRQLPKEVMVDKHDLDDECAAQAGVYVRWAERAARARDERDRKDHELRQHEAYLDQQLREDAKDEKPKPTESAIKARMVLEESHQRLQDAVFDARMVSAFCDSAKQAFEQRRSMLKYLCELWLGEYYSELQVNDNEYMEEKFRERQQGNKRRKLTRKRREED